MNVANCTWYTCAFLSVILGAGCGSGASQQIPETHQAARETFEQAEEGKTHPSFSEGGAITLNVQGQPVSIAVDSADLANTDSGYADYLEISGPGTFLCAAIDPKMPDGEGDVYYKPIVGRVLPMNLSLDLMPTPREITIPNQGKYPVTGGSVTMDQFQIGMDGRDMWEGRIEVTVQTSQGPTALSGTFKFCVVPVW